MASEKITAIEMFAELLILPLPDAIKDFRNNNHYKPKDEIVDSWTVIVKKDEKKIVLRFAYQMKANIVESEKWINQKLWTIECVVAQGNYVVIDLEKQEDQITFILQEASHPFNKNECELGSPDARYFNLEKEFQDYACNAPWIGKRLGRLLNNVTRVNGANYAPSPSLSPLRNEKHVHNPRSTKGLCMDEPQIDVPTFMNIPAVLVSIPMDVPKAQTNTPKAKVSNFWPSKVFF